jgi:hypoxanthine phosphoribosyltransferase
VKLKPQPLLNKDKIRQVVSDIAERINQDYAGKTVVLVAILKGSFLFVADLARKLNLETRIEFIGVSSYEGTESTGHVRLTQDLSRDIENEHVILVEDIVDTGRTLDYLINTLSLRKPASLEVCTLLSKPSCRVIEVPVKYIGSEIPNHFVVGYGLDYNERWRDLPEIFEVQE